MFKEYTKQTNNTDILRDHVLTKMDIGFKSEEIKWFCSEIKCQLNLFRTYPEVIFN